MSSSHTTINRQDHQGSMRSYVAGFILSLVFTLVPYYLVVNQTVTGTLLLMAIMGCAVIQMLIQITFFLHLGRGPKPKWNLFFFVSTISIILLVVIGSVVIIDNLHYNMQPSDQTKKLIGGERIYQVGGKKTGACQGQHNNHQITIMNGQVNPLHTTAKLCDTLTFINKSNEIVDIAFSEHPRHIAYAGEADLIVKKGKSQTITLSESGTYIFHDHLRPEVAGNFTVTP